MESRVQKINLIVLGAKGRMGARIMALAAADARFSHITGLDKGDSLDAVLPKADVCIDFTAPEAAVLHADKAAQHKKALVVGTTGIEREGLQALKKASKKIPVVFSPNMSVGVNVLFQLVRQAAAAMPGADIEIVEAHHNLKKDAPSGTAMKLADVAAAASRRLPENFIFGRHGLIGARQKKEIGVLSVRAGDIVGDHTVYFAHEGERLELTHRAHSRDTFAAGALTAAAWVTGRRAGLYSMADVLGFSSKGE